MSRPSPKEFFEKSKLADVLAISCTVQFDCETAISLADRFVNEEHFFLLESATPGPGGISRYSFLGFDPLWDFVCDGNTYTCGWRDEQEEFPLSERNPLKILEDLWSTVHLEAVPEESKQVDGADLSSSGGIVGFVSYDAAHLMEPSVGRGPDPEVGLPLIHKYLPRNFLVLDQLSRKLTIVRYVRTRFDWSYEEADTVLRSEWQSLLDIQHRVTRPHIAPELRLKPSQEVDFDACSASFEKEDFLSEVQRCLELIRAGEVYQIQIGNRLSCETKARPFDVFRHLRILNPSPYMVFYKVREHHLICASPEMMVNVQPSESKNKKVLHRPIAGTRKRYWNAEKDAQMKAELQSDEKERSEHVMLVDLSRNDIGRIALPGSVHVDELMVVEEYSHVFHLVSQVSALLRRDCSAFQALSDSFPNGTVSGAPKIRAMQHIARIEPVAREFYAGSLGLFDFSGNLRSTILIRTLHMANGRASTQASAGVVYDSVAENEWQETKNKMRACLLAMQNTL